MLKTSSKSLYSGRYSVPSSPWIKVSFEDPLFQIQFMLQHIPAQEVKPDRADHAESQGESNRGGHDIRGHDLDIGSIGHLSDLVAEIGDMGCDDGHDDQREDLLDEADPDKGANGGEQLVPGKQVPDRGGDIDLYDHAKRRDQCSDDQQPGKERHLIMEQAGDRVGQSAEDFGGIFWREYQDTYGDDGPQEVDDDPDDRGQPFSPDEQIGGDRQRVGQVSLLCEDGFIKAVAAVEIGVKHNASDGHDRSK